MHLVQQSMRFVCHYRVDLTMTEDVDDEPCKDLEAIAERMIYFVRYLLQEDLVSPISDKHINLW